MIKRPRYQHAAVRRNSDEVGPLGKACASPVDDDLWYTRAAAARASLPRCRDMPRSFALRIARRRPLAHDEAGLHDGDDRCALVLRDRSEEHTSELQSLMRNSYAVFCLKKQQNRNT